MADVFISYSQPDREIASALAERLHGTGFTVTLDISVLLPGENFSEALTDEIARAKAVLLLLSQHSSGSMWAPYELIAALQQGDRTRVIPILLDAFAKENSIWPIVADRQVVELRSPDQLDPVVKKIAMQIHPSALESTSESSITLPKLTIRVPAVQKDGPQARDWAWQSVIMSTIEMTGDFSHIFYIPPSFSAGHQFKWEEFFELIKDRVLREQISDGVIAMLNGAPYANYPIADIERRMVYNIFAPRIKLYSDKSFEMEVYVANLEALERGGTKRELLTALNLGLQFRAFLIDTKDFGLNLETHRADEESFKRVVVSFLREIDLFSARTAQAGLEFPWFSGIELPMYRAAIDSQKNLYTVAEYVLNSSGERFSDGSALFVKACDDYRRISEELNRVMVAQLIHQMLEELQLTESVRAASINRKAIFG